MCFRLAVLSLFVSGSVFGQTYIITTFAGGGSRPPLSAQRSIGVPAGVKADSAGNVYFASQNCIFKLDSQGAMTRIAGNYTAGYSGDGGPATAAQLSYAPTLLAAGNAGAGIGIAVDSAGNLYVPDGNRIRKISPDGIITTIAGGDGWGHSGDGSPASQATLESPHHLALAGDGSLYIAEGQYAEGQWIRKISPSGIISTVASFSIDAVFGPTGIAADAAGDVYVAYNYTVRRINPDGSLTTIAGTGTYGYSGDGNSALSAELSVGDLALDGAGNLYLADYGRIRKITAVGIITTIAGTGMLGYSGDGGPAISASLTISGISADAAGNLYIADAGSRRIRKVSANGIISTVAGDGTTSLSGDGGEATAAQLANPTGLAVDRAGNLYIADSGNDRIRKVSPDGIITTVAGSSNPLHSVDGGLAINAGIIASGVTVDDSGSLLLTDLDRIRKVSLDGIISTVAGTTLLPPHGGSYYELAVDKTGTFYVSGYMQGFDTYKTLTAKIPPGGPITALMGAGNNPASDCCIAVDSNGGFYYTYTYGGGYNVIFSTSGTILPPTAGNGCSYSLPSDGPWGDMSFDRIGNLFAIGHGFQMEAGPNGIFHSTQSTIRRFSPSGGMNVIAGSGPIGYSGDGGPALDAQIDPMGIAVDGVGNIYFSDMDNNVVRVLRPVPSPPTIAAVVNGASNLAGPVAPGELVLIAGSSLGGRPLLECGYGATGLNDTILNETQVLFNGIPARLLYTFDNQVAALVPYGVALGPAQVSVTFQGVESASFPVTVNTSAPGIFTVDQSGKGQAVVVNQSGKLNGIVSPGEYMTLYVTGEGQTSPAGVDGQLAKNPLPHPILPVTVTIGGRTVQPQYAGGAPGYFAGLMQVNVQIPDGTPPGDVPITIQVGPAVSRPGVTIAVL